MLKCAQNVFMLNNVGLICDWFEQALDARWELSHHSFSSQCYSKEMHFLQLDAKDVVPFVELRFKINCLTIEITSDQLIKIHFY